MNSLVEKFNKIYGNKPTKLKVKFFEEEPFTVRNARYNQSGLMCYCMQGKTLGKEKDKNVWKEKECLENCEYLISKDNQKPACMEEGTLKFLLPEISNDRVWIMKVRGITVIDKISDYIISQGLIGNSMIGEFYLYLKKEEHIRQSDGQKFTNYTIDILKIDNQEIPIIQPEQQEIMSQSQNNHEIQKKNKSQNTIITTKKKNNDKTTTSKKTTTNNVITMNNQNNIKFETVNEGEYDVDKCYCYLGVKPIEIVNKGQKLNYTIGTFIDSNDKEVSAIVNQDLANELKSCDLGTIVLIETVNKLNHLWVTDFKYVQKMLKEAV